MRENYKTTFHTHKFFIHGNNKSILLFQKGVYPSEYMDDVEKNSETSLPEEEDFYSHIYMEEKTDAGYVDAKEFFKDFEVRNLGEYRHLYVQSSTLLSADVFVKL